MGQYPSPYSPPPASTDPRYPGAITDPLAPAKRAAIALLIIGVLGLLLGMCLGLGVVVVTTEQLQQISEQISKSSPGAPHLEVGLLRNLYTGAAVASLVAGVILITLGIFVYRANKVASVFAVILCGLALLYLCLNEIGVLIGALSNPLMALGACVFLVPIVLLGLTTMWLLQVLKSLPQLEAARQQWQAQYAAMQQQQRAYGQGQYGLGFPPPPPGYVQPPAGVGPIGGQASVGYGAMPSVIPTPTPMSDAQNNPAVRHPPLPPDEPPAA